MAESVGAFEFYLQETLKDLSENGKQIDLKPEQGAAIKSLVHGQDVLAILPMPQTSFVIPDLVFVAIGEIFLKKW